MERNNKRDETICSVKGYFQNESAQSVLSLLCRDSTWVIIRQRDALTDSVSKLHTSFQHSFYKTTLDARDTWHVTWNSFDQTKCNFRSYHAVEARSLDRGLRIVKNEMKNDIILHNSNNSAVTCVSDRAFNDYTLEPHYLAHHSPVPYQAPLKSEVNPSSPDKPHKHCPTCGRKFKSNRRSRCWARFSSMLCCTSDFDSIV